MAQQKAWHFRSFNPIFFDAPMTGTRHVNTSPLQIFILKLNSYVHNNSPVRTARIKHLLNTKIGKRNILHRDS